MIQRAKLNFYDCVLRPNPSRTVVRPFDPHYPRDFAGGTSRAQETVDLIVALDEVELARQLKGVTLSLDENHRDVDTMLLRRFEEVAGGIEGVGRINAKQRRLIGAYFSEEFAYEAAALFNPSAVLHPDQSVSRGHPPFRDVAARHWRGTCVFRDVPHRDLDTGRRTFDR
jgi:hypothetical protein